jgi:hypothetical protein
MVKSGISRRLQNQTDLQQPHHINTNKKDDPEGKTRLREALETPGGLPRFRGKKLFQELKF